jgi:hypothetical protein
MKISALVLAASMAASLPAMAGDIVVIVNKQNEFHVSKRSVAAMYLGQTKQWPGGMPVGVIDLPGSNVEREAFAKSFLGMEAHQVKDVVAQNIAAGKAAAPREVASDDEVKKAVSSSRFVIGYIKASSVDDSVKVALTQ